jgi:hypothetical protein
MTWLGLHAGNLYARLRWHRLANTIHARNH